MPYLMGAEIWREWIWFPIPKNQCADSIEKSTRDEQGDRSHAKLSIDGTDQKNDDPPHKQITDVRHQDRDFCEENGFDRNEEES